MKSASIPDGTILLDTDGKITPAVLKAILAYRYELASGVLVPVGGIIRYASLFTINTTQDASPAEANMILGELPYFGMVQHCLAAPEGRTGWMASAAEGTKKGATAHAHADLVEYPTDSHLAYDDEDVEDGDISAEIEAWSEAIDPRPACNYVGYASGLTAEGQWLLSTVHVYWGAPGPWDVATCGFALRQQLKPVTIGGMQFDVNIASADKLGRRIILATAS